MNSCFKKNEKTVKKIASVLTLVIQRMSVYRKKV